jgi:hypothetical protein
MLLQCSGFHSLLWLISVLLCVYIPHFLYTFISWWILKLIVISWLLRTGNLSVHIMSLSILISFASAVYQGVGTTVSHGASVFKSFRNIHTVCVSVLITFPSTVYRASFCPHPHQHWLSLVFLKTVINTGMRWYLAVIFSLFYTSAVFFWKMSI